MIIFTNKYGELLNIDETKDKIEVLRNYNNLIYEVKVNDKTMKKINFNTPKFKDKEYPIMIILPNQFKRYMFVGADKEKINKRNNILATYICADRKYKIKARMLKLNLFVSLQNIMLWFKKFMWCGILGRQNIYIDKITIQEHYSEFLQSYNTMKSANQIIDLVEQFNKKYIDVKKTKKNSLKYTRELIDFANKINIG